VIRISSLNLIVDIATDQVEDREPTPEEQGKDPAAVSLGRRGGLKGGLARSAKMTGEQRAEAARMVIKRREARDRCRGRCGTFGEENRVPIHARARAFLESVAVAHAVNCGANADRTDPRF
jgi:hypothetical protein